MLVTVEQVEYEVYGIGSPGFYYKYRIQAGDVVATIAGPGPDHMGWCPEGNPRQLAAALGVRDEYVKDSKYVWGLVKAAQRVVKGDPDPARGIWSAVVEAS